MKRNTKPSPSKNARRNPKPIANYELETAALNNGAQLIAGVDEAGRGPWAGPVVAAAVVLEPQKIPNGIADSKALDEAKREHVFDDIQNCASVGIGIADVERIDRDNILAATMWAMGEAIAALPEKPCLALIDGNRSPPLACAARTIVKGDATCLSIAAASIVAKVTRDRIMRELAKTYPDYGFDKHKGYGTRQHQEALTQHGLIPQHRHSFKPIKALLINPSDVKRRG